MPVGMIDRRKFAELLGRPVRSRVLGRENLLGFDARDLLLRRLDWRKPLPRHPDRQI